jgi:hypothetical protein
MVCVPYFIPRISPTSSHARRSRSISFLVCEEDRQNRTRELINGVALFVRIDYSFRWRNLRVSNDNDDDGGLVVSDSIQHHLREEVHSRR